MSERAFLLIADISGYTRFVSQPSISASHARLITGRLLKALVGVSRPPMRIAELEGDAVFFYAPTDASASVGESLRSQIVNLCSAFAREVREIDTLQTCACDACAHVGDLKLKQVVHEGEIARERIGKFRKLFGRDVVVVHRMLKNGVTEREYVLMTQQAFDSLGGFFGMEPRIHEEELEGIGPLRMLLFDAPEFKREHAPTPRAIQRARWRWEISWRTLLHWLRLRPLTRRFRNLPS